MKILNILLAAGLMLAGQSAAAQAKIDAYGRTLLDLHKSGKLTHQQSTDLFATPASRSAEPTVAVIVETNSTAVLDSLENLGYVVTPVSQDFAVVEIPVDGIETLAQSTEVATLSFGHKAEPAMDKARGASRANTAHSGLGISFQGSKKRPFKGDGVIVGMFDTGFDPAHVNFYNDDLSETRLKYYARFSGSSTSPTIYTGDRAATAPTDNEEETHGTHVAGIMGGAYNDDGVYYQYDDDTNRATDIGYIPLYGIAPHAELAICAGPLYNASILVGIRKLIDYANSQGKPLVVNLSLGGNSGPHDGSDSFCRALDQLGRECIICIAAGNEGSDKIHAGKVLDATGSMKVLVNKNSANRLIDIWSSTPDEIKVSILTVRDGKIMSKITSVNNGTVSTANGNEEAFTIFRASFDGTITMTAQRDGNRYNVAFTATNVTRKSGNNDLLGIMVEGPEGARIDLYGNADTSFSSVTTEGFEKGNNDGSINGLACGFNVIAVGAYSSRTKYADLTGSIRNAGGDGTLSTFSSWGELVDGRTLPHISAPGQGILSSYSGPWLKKNTLSESGMSARATFNNAYHYWGEMDGTSMATPYVTGTVGLWLEANPNLAKNVDVLRNYMTSTSLKDANVTSAIAWGAGKVNVAEGLKAVISGIGGVSDVIADGASEILISQNGNSFEAFYVGAGNVSLRLYTIAGTLAAAAEANGDTATIEAPAPGMYVLSATAGAQSETRKVLVK